MNIILFDPAEVERPLPQTDARASHILKVLRLKPGDLFDAGLINGPMGKGTLVAASANSLVLLFSWEEPPLPLYPIHLLIGLPRPQTARDILRETTTLGVSSIYFFSSETGEASYASSSLWKTDEWKNCVINGAAQAFCTRLPEIRHNGSLTDALNDLPTDASRLALDNYEASVSISDFNPVALDPIIVAIGSERGWSAKERFLLRETGFNMVHLGPRVLRTETACIAAVTLIRSKLGLF